MRITGLSAAEARRIRALQRRKARDEQGLLLAEGVRVVEELVASGLPIRLAAVAPSAEATERGRALAAALEDRAPVHRVDDRSLDALAATETPQGVLAVAEIPRRTLERLPDRDAAPVVLVLDAVQDPGNFGTLVRTADAFAVGFVAALPGTVDPWNPKAVRASAGASFRVPIVQPEPDELVDWLRRRDFTIYGADAGAPPVDAAPRAARIALVVGNEGVGLGPTMRSAVDAWVAIPTAGHVESLNVAIAAGILLYLLTRGAETACRNS